MRHLPDAHMCASETRHMCRVFPSLRGGLQDAHKYDDRDQYDERDQDVNQGPESLSLRTQRIQHVYGFSIASLSCGSSDARTYPFGAQAIRVCASHMSD